MQGKSITFVTNSSTSGFKIPAHEIVKIFNLKDNDEVIQEGKVFSKVIFGGSHPGAQVNLFKKDSDIATFAIPKSFTIYELTSGQENKAGATYKVNAEVKAQTEKDVLAKIQANAAYSDRKSVV